MSQDVVFEGVLHGEGVTFNCSPDRSVFAFLYDNFAVEWLPRDRSDKDSKTASRRLRLAVGPGSAGHLLVLDLRGASFGTFPEGSALTVQIGGSTESVPLAQSDDDTHLFHRVEAPLQEDRQVVDIVVTATVPKPESGDVQATIQVDSIDIGLAPPAA